VEQSVYCQNSISISKNLEDGTESFSVSHTSIAHKRRALEKNIACMEMC